MYLNKIDDNCPEANFQQIEKSGLENGILQLILHIRLKEGDVRRVA